MGIRISGKLRGERRAKLLPKRRPKQRLTLYLLVGYPGAGKTTTSQIIHELSGAAHIWADYERQVMFGTPTHSKAESKQLYDHLNAETDMLLADEQSVIFDTNFNFRSDRDLLRSIAERHGALVRVVWIRTAKDIAKQRALHVSHAMDNNYVHPMRAADFERIVKHLEPPTEDEAPVILEGSQITPEYVADALELPRGKLRELSKIFRTSDVAAQHESS